MPAMERMAEKGASFDRLADAWENWKRRVRYCYGQVARRLRFFIPPGCRFLEVGCATRMVELACRKPPDLRFGVISAEDPRLDTLSDYIIPCSLAADLDDVQKV